MIDLKGRWDREVLTSTTRGDCVDIGLIAHLRNQRFAVPVIGEVTRIFCARTSSLCEARVIPKGPVRLSG